MIKQAAKKKNGAKKETFMQGVITLIFSQLLIKVLGLVYSLYLTNREGFGAVSYTHLDVYKRQGHYCPFWDISLNHLFFYTIHNDTTYNKFNTKNQA